MFAVILIAFIVSTIVLIKAQIRKERNLYIAVKQRAEIKTKTGEA